MRMGHGPAAPDPWRGIGPCHGHMEGWIQVSDLELVGDTLDKHGIQMKIYTIVIIRHCIRTAIPILANFDFFPSWTLWLVGGLPWGQS